MLSTIITIGFLDPFDVAVWPDDAVPPNHWPAPADDAVRHQVDRRPPIRPASSRGAERRSPPVHRPGCGQ